jgi:predicted nucleic acid-binding protein
MILIDTNVIIDARDPTSRFRPWAQNILAHALSTEGVALNAIVLTELCVGHKAPEAIEAELRADGLNILDLPAAASALCALAYTRYRLTRRRSGGGEASHIPLPDFFIGAHAELMKWKLATRDVERYRIYFPSVELIEPGEG